MSLDDSVSAIFIGYINGLLFVNTGLFKLILEPDTPSVHSVAPAYHCPVLHRYPQHCGSMGVQGVFQCRIRVVHRREMSPKVHTHSLGSLSLTTHP